ncbi:MAG: 2OG-Fe(II) oxygenase, partial [Pseudomonadota bacterium]
NYDGVARLLRGEDPKVKRISLSPGALNVFRGKNTPHRVTPPEGARNRTIAVLSFYETPGVAFSAVERQGFYGRS